MARFLRSTDPKDIGILYLATSFAFFLAGGALALLMRAELARPGLQFLSVDQYNQLFTMHGTIMLLLYATPITFGFANYILPLQIGAPDVAFPRLNAFSYWLFLFGGLTVISGFLTPGGAADFGWTAYTPLSNVVHSPGVGGDLWIMGLVVAGLGTILGGVNMLTTVICLRAPGMTMFRMPVFTWNIFITTILMLLAFPVLTAGLLGLEADRHLGAHVFDPANGGAILWQHLFWFFGHPEVYIVALPFFGIATEVMPVFSRKPLFGYKALVYATISIAALSTAVWAHHMYATGAVLLTFFSFTTFLIAIPTGIKFFNWIGTMWKGQLTFETPMLFSIGFLVTFLFGGLTGVLLASPPVDFHVSDTYFVVAHFHYVLFGTIVFATYSGIYFWFPKMTGRMMDETLGKVHFWLTFIGFHLTFLVQHWLGAEGMPRRYADYLRTDGFTALNTISSIGAFVLGTSTLPFIWNVVRSYRYGREVTVDDPWGHGNSLEWATSCPPPRHNFTEMPRIRSERPAFELHYQHLVPRLRAEGHASKRREDPAEMGPDPARVRRRGHHLGSWVAANIVVTNVADMSGFHEGERLVQDRAHVRENADRIGGMLAPARLGASTSNYLAAQSMIVITARDHEDLLWSTAVHGTPGFITVNASGLHVAARLRDNDPLVNPRAGQPIGAIAIDLKRRRRLRINGLLTSTVTGLTVEVAQAYGNCPRYIQPRLDHSPQSDSTQSIVSYQGHELTAEHRGWIARSTRMFVGSTHPSHGVDASHRGGPAGFVQVIDGRLWWPDYPGNNLFNTLGNIAVDPHSSLLFVDFERDRSLHLSGTAEIDWSMTHLDAIPANVQRGVWFHPQQIVQIDPSP